MGKKYFFFDLDGTLLSKNHEGEILDSTIKTIQQLKQNNHFVSIATGRGQWHALPVAMKAGIDHMVSDGGNGITINQEVVEIEPLNIDLARSLIKEALDHGYEVAVAIDNSSRLYSHQNLTNAFPWSTGVIIDPKLDYSALERIYKIFIDVFEDDYQLDGLNKAPHLIHAKNRIVVEPNHKYEGIKKILEYVNGEEKDVVVFGDGVNDIEMFTNAAFSIAMGNAVEPLKEIANYITESHTEDGIYLACKKFGWIE